VKKQKLNSLLLIIIASFFSACEGSDSQKNHNEKPAIQPSAISYAVIKSYPHDTASFTQGLEIYQGILYESTGNPENVAHNGAWIGKVNLATGIAEKKALLSPNIFGEGITILNGKIYRLSWQNQKAFVYTLKDISPLKEYFYQGEGWGLTNDGKHLIMSNGSNILSYRDPETFKEIRQISVHDHTGMKNNLNELEFINGQVFANVWQTNLIIRIDTANGNVTGIMDMTDLIKQDPLLSMPPADVLNGIAWDSTSKKIYITGKKWPKLFEIKLNQ
jgi:glutamine cyclotransferase